MAPVKMLVPCPAKIPYHNSHVEGSGKLLRCMNRTKTRELVHEVIHCKYCGEKHIDTGRFAAFNHNPHLCYHCKKLFYTDRKSIGIQEES